MSIKALVDKYDSENFLNWLEKFPEQVDQAVKLGREISPLRTSCDSIFVGGMGGSGIAGDLVASFLYDKLKIPVTALRYYDLPAAVDENSLFIGVSYSGNTEETLALFEEAGLRGAKRLAVTSGGELGQITGEDSQIGLIKIPAGQPPRASAPYLFLPIIYWLAASGFVSSPSAEALEETLKELRQLTSKLAPSADNNTAYRLAKKIHDCYNLIYGSQPLTSILALRLKNQLNENAKMIAVANEFPELNHNEIMGWRQLGEVKDNWRGIFLRDSSEHPRVTKRFEITEKILSESVKGIDELSGRGNSRLSRFLTLMLFTDYVSYYCALLRGEDPSEIKSIERLKDKL